MCSKVQKNIIVEQFFSPYCVNKGEKDNQPIKVLMMQDYDFFGTDTCADMQVVLRPSEQVVKNIIDFARSYETVEVGGLRFELFLN